MNYIEIFYKKDEFDVVSKARIKDIETAGYEFEKFKFRTEQIYKLDGDFSSSELTRIASELLVDPIIQNYETNTKDDEARYKDFYIADIWLKKGVTDPVGETVENGIKTLGINKDSKVNTGFRYLIDRKLDEKIVSEIVAKLLMNSVIQECEIRNL